MRTKIALALLAAAGLVLCLVISSPRKERATTGEIEVSSTTNLESVQPVPPAGRPSSLLSAAKTSRPASSAPQQAPAENVRPPDRLERLAQIREQFHLMAAGAAQAAMAAARQLTNETERETALMTLVTEWTHGYLRSSAQRAQAIAQYCLEAGLGMELAKNPELATLWANELTQGAGRAALLGQIAAGMARSDVPAAFALGDSLTGRERQEFFNLLYAGWATQDTEAALKTIEQLDDPATRDAALQAIRSVAPVGIGAAISVDAGYPVINDLIPNAPADLSGLLQKGDRIIALAQGDSAYVDARNLSLQEIIQMIRGAPGTTLQLQLLSADAPPDSPPRAVTIVRDQIKFKQ